MAGGFQTPGTLPAGQKQSERLTLAALRCISHHSQGVLGAADLVAYSLHSISVKKRLENSFFRFLQRFG